MRLIEDRLNSGEVDYKDVVTVFLAMQRQNFVLANSLINLVEKWPKDQSTTNEVLPMFGILLENKDSTSTEEMLSSISAEQVTKVVNEKT